jgi:hypothetical protein
MRGIISIKIGRTFFGFKFFRLYSEKFLKKAYGEVCGMPYKSEPEKCDVFFGFRAGFFKLGIKLNIKQGEAYDGLYFYFGLWSIKFIICTKKAVYTSTG